jgi:hypothetical protein
MQPSESLPRSATQLLGAFRPCFSARGFATFTALITGLIVVLARRTVCGMFTGSRMHTVWHHSRAHRFFATTRWSPDQVALVQPLAGRARDAARLTDTAGMAAGLLLAAAGLGIAALLPGLPGLLAGRRHGGSRSPPT